MLCRGWQNKSAKLTWHAIAKLNIFCWLIFFQKEIFHVVNAYVMNYSFNVQMSTVKIYSGFNKSQGQSNIFLYKQNKYRWNTYYGSEWGYM